ncbi:ArsR family transcriptional regulator [Halomarina salina]|uniref:ArsR family transcriptional regulator n=1 Tax=Halomarina salina TaxID=1872699 RepID=A0ABD5RHM4_9EURY|nr:ArsR family transcriptional regulator [Halomarina salina]
MNDSDSPTLPPALADERPSVKLVYRELADDGPLTRGEIDERCYFQGGSTGGDALARLTELGVIEMRHNFEDLRRPLYVVCNGDG